MSAAHLRRRGGKSRGKLRHRSVFCRFPIPHVERGMMATRAMPRVPARTQVPLFLPEPLEGRRLFAVALVDPATQPKFVNLLPIPAVAQPVTLGGNHYDIAVTQFQQDLGLVNPSTGQALATTVWGYGGSYPGPTIEAGQDQPITVRW